MNPHDIWVAPGFSEDSGYHERQGSEFELQVPGNVDEDLSTKPTAQGLYRFIYNTQTVEEFGPSKSLELHVNQSNYVNFYAYLQTVADQHVMRILDELDAQDLTRKTLIVRLADHGEQGMAHGMREKMYNAYEETIHVPLIVSNPVLFPEPQETKALASWVDILPTLARITGVYDQYEYVFRGVDLTPVIENPKKSVQELVHFCYDDGYLVGNVPPYIRAIRGHDWLYAVYFNNKGSLFEYEMYDLHKDPSENRNLAGLPEHEDQLRSLHEKLVNKMKLAGTAPSGIPLVSPLLEAEAKESHKIGLIPDPHWPTPDEAVEQSRVQRQGEQPDYEQLAGELEHKGFWMAVTQC